MSELQFTTNSITAKATERIGKDGRRYLVAPGVPVVAGVLGDELLTVEEIAKFPDSWNGRRLPLTHPQANGDYISANSPELDDINVGYFYNARFDHDRIRGEYWIDIERAEALGGDAAMVLNRLQANDKIETSTAYFRDSEQSSGTYNGRPYTSIARNIVPDHIAVLVNERGKCSIADGCGLLANQDEQNAGSDSQNMSSDESTLQESEMTDEKKVDATEEPKANEPSADVKETEENEAPAANADCGCNDGLSANADSDIAKIVANAVAEAMKPLQDELAGVKANAESASKFVANAEKAQKDALLSQLVANQSEFTREELAEMPVPALEKLARLSAPAVTFDFSGRGIPQQFAANADSEWEEYKIEEAN